MKLFIKIFFGIIGLFFFIQYFGGLFFMVLIPYLIGSIPFGFLLTKIMGGGDIRKTGSGNIGATNVMRALGKKAGYITFVLDVLKGVLIVFLVDNMNYLAMLAYESDSYKKLSEQIINPANTLSQYYMFGIATVIGHCFPVWLKFRGGKGVSTALGIVAYTHLLIAPQLWWVLLIIAAVWIGTFKLTKVVSIASIATFIAIPIMNYIIFNELLFSCILSAIIIIRHKDNISRLIKGNEHSFNKK
jgi:glycerol-3-phosphate acyltransferase PlsY